MRGRGPLQSLAASPTMVGAITTLIVIVAVFLAYNANQGLPFVPTYRVSVEIPNAARLVNNNEVRIGGHRVGVVESIEAVQPSGQPPASQSAATGQNAASQSTVQPVARLNLKLDQDVEPLPKDSTFRVRYRSSFGLKYLEITRGDGQPAPEGFVYDEPENFIEQTEFDDINNTFDAPTRRNSRINLEGFGNAFAGRGASLNQAIESLNPLLTNLKPVAETLNDPGTRFERFFPELADSARIVAPVAETQAELFTNMAIAFAAISEDEEALKATISEGPPTLETGIETLPRQRPFLRDFTTLSRLLEPGAEELRRALPTFNDALEVGTPVLLRTPPMNEDLRAAFGELEQLVEQPSTKVTLQRLEELFDEADPLAEHVVPAQTVCNYWNYWFTFLPEHLSEPDQVGFQQRIAIIGFPRGNTYAPSPPFSDPNTVLLPGEVSTPLAAYSGIQANARAGVTDDPSDPLGEDNGGGEFKPYEEPILHGPPYSPTGQRGADCQSGQTGYPLGEFRVPGQSPDSPALVASDYPGSRGPTTLFYKQNGKRLLVDTRVESRQP
jgi:ABC-type transporter Mla subunit MlaD